ncbi:MAG: DUF2911 domain-containing protein, partial [Candidatus Binatia bacterium]
MSPRIRLAALALAVALLGNAGAGAQLVTLPPNGDNQKSSVSQWIGLVEVNVTYNSPNVHAPDGSDRRGKIWGQLVPWGLSNAGFGTCGDLCPWRMGANENTVFRVSHDVMIEGQPLAAGSYGLHAVPGEKEWTIVFSSDSTSWGSFFYEESEDVLRVAAKPAKSDYREWLTFEFVDRQPDRATLQLAWEDLAVPFTVSVPNVDELYFRKIDQELRNANGFTWNAFVQATQFCLQKSFHLEHAEEWARYAVSPNGIGQENFDTLANLAMVQQAAGKSAEAAATLDRAVNHRSASPVDIHQAARQLQLQKRQDEAIRLFELNARKFPGEWPVDVGMMRAYAAKGDAEKALEFGRKALAGAPDAGNRQNLERLVARL